MSADASSFEYERNVCREPTLPFGPCACYWLLPCIFGIHDRGDPIEGSLENRFEESFFTELPFYPNCRPLHSEGQCW